MEKSCHEGELSMSGIVDFLRRHADIASRMLEEGKFDFDEAIVVKALLGEEILGTKDGG